jgi:hypothetical protein
MSYAVFAAAAAALAAAAFAGLAGLDLPKEPLKILPFLVLISPLPIVNQFIF